MSTNDPNQLVEKALNARTELIEKLKAEKTDTYRLFHGVTEGLPGLTIDRYGPQVLIQSFQPPLLTENQVKEVKELISGHLGFEPVMVYNDRSGLGAQTLPLEGEPDPSTPYICEEFGVKYRVIGSHNGQDPLLYLDLRSGRRFLMAHCEGKSVLNLFAYTCGAGVAAAAAGADDVWNVDFSRPKLEYGKENAALNNIDDQKIRFVHQNVIPVIRQLSGLGLTGRARKKKCQRFNLGSFDMVFMDPPTFAKSPFGAIDIKRDYQGIFKPALLCVKPGGMLICTNHAAAVELDEWLQLLTNCAEKADRPIAKIEIIEPEPDFPSPDKRFPLKIAVCYI